MLNFIFGNPFHLHHALIDDVKMKIIHLMKMAARNPEIYTICIIINYNKLCLFLSFYNALQ